MIEYPKIETLFDRDEKFKVMPDKWRLPEFAYLCNNTWIWTEKIDGTNIRVEWIPGAPLGVIENSLRFGGKTDNAQMPPHLLRKLEQLFPEDKFKTLSPEIPMVLYGEGFGAKIQKGGGNYNPTDCDFILFDVLIEKWWLERSNVEDIASKLGIKVVPIVGTGILLSAVEKVRAGFNSTFGNFPAEGLVVRPDVSLMTRKGGRVIGKIKNKDF